MGIEPMTSPLRGRPYTHLVIGAAAALKCAALERYDAKGCPAQIADTKAICRFFAAQQQQKKKEKCIDPFC